MSEESPRSRTPLDEERIIRECSATIPTAIIAEILGIDVLTVTRRRRKLGVNLSFSDGHRITKEFLANPPDLSGLPLSDEDAHAIRLARLAWVNRHEAARTHEHRARQIILHCTGLLPTRAIAAVLGVSADWVLKRERTLAIALERSTRRSLEHRFCSADAPPEIPILEKAERRALRRVWMEAHGEEVERRKVRAQRSDRYARELRQELLRERRTLREQPSPPEERTCSGACGEQWPATKRFFTPNWRRDDGLSLRCVLCRFNESLTRRRDPRSVKRRRRGRTLRPDERPRIVEIFRRYSNIIPPGLLRRLFRLGEGSFERLRHDAGVTMTMRDSRSVLWRWFFRRVIPPLELLTEDELAELVVMTKHLRTNMERRFERDPELVMFLRTERARILRAGKVEEWQCRRCKSTWPAQVLFFRYDGQTLSRICKPCVNEIQAQRRRDRLERRFGH